MALLRSDIINKDFIEQVLKQSEGTNRVTLSTLTVSPSDCRAGLLEERLNILVQAFIRGRAKEFDWIAKVLRAESGPANYARFQGLLETEINFYAKLWPELGKHLKAPLPPILPFLWGNYESLNREVLLLQRRPAFEYASNKANGLDLPHVLLAVEWLAKLHGMSFVVKRLYEQENPKGEDWLSLHPWIRKGIEESINYAPPENEDVKHEEDVAGNSAQGLKARLVNMAKRALQMESTPSSLDKLIERQDWLDEMRRESLKSSSTQQEDSFFSVCHGQPWVGNVCFRYETDDQGQRYPVEAIFTDFQSCAYGRCGQDVAHFLLASTTRQFRQDHLETVLQAYLTELEDVIAHQGVFDGGPFYTPTALRHDYKRGIYTGITFCLFAMPLLASPIDGGDIDDTKEVTDDVDGIEMSASFNLQRAADALLDYVTDDI